jgi:hypothetical protein
VERNIAPEDHLIKGGKAVRVVGKCGGRFYSIPLREMLVAAG